MTIFGGAVVFVIIWWCVFFIVLPWGVRVPEAPEKGHASSAPARPRLALKAAVTTGISLVLWGAVYWIIAAGLISFREP